VTCELTIHVDPAGRETHVGVAGVLDASSANTCLKQLLRAMHLEFPRLIVDLSQAELVDTAGLGILQAARAQAVTLGGHLRLVGIPEYLWPMIAQERLAVADVPPGASREGRLRGTSSGVRGMP
jgi:anti-anti-sigma factor